ncbi:WD40 repeat-like protein [Xylariaceae sp. FL0594]|nr:WD40 repeat-like protein [Xylariaceae sp. FL0594]
MKEYLDSNRVNFLIWRYLLEGNYRETAVKFQKEWHVREPHRQLDFAPYVKSHALVNVLNKGLLYHSLEREYEQATQVPSAGVAEAKTRDTQLGVFGPLKSQPPPPPTPSQEQQLNESDEDAEAEPDTEMQLAPPAAAAQPSATTTAAVTTSENEVENPRKRQVDKQRQPSLTNGSPSKRPRLSNGYENAVVDAATTPMELDGPHQQGDNHAYPSPLEGEQAPVHTDGAEQGTQVEKVQSLAGETTYISLDAGFDDASGLSPRTAQSRTNSESAPVLLHCQWHPRDPSILAAAGTDALARIWNINRGALADPAVDDHVNTTVPDFCTLVDQDASSRATVTAMAWDWEGSLIAVATDSDSKARLTLWSPEGVRMHQFEVAEPPIIKLRWSPNNSAILAIAPDNGGALITLYHPLTLNTSTYYLSNYDLLNAEPLDASWVNDSDFMLCGGELLILLRFSDSKVSEIKRFETRNGDIMTQVHFDPKSSLVATCSDKGFVDIWDISGKRREIKAHTEPVTCLAWQPAKSAVDENERLLASGGEDGAISIWNVMAPTDSKAYCTMTMHHPIVALAFTPDGAFIAGATSEKILIWKVGDYNVPRASWDRQPGPNWPPSRTSLEPDEEDEHCLGWDATGHKLAYGVNNRLAIISFR